MPHQFRLPGFLPPAPAPECREAREALRDYPDVPGHVMCRYSKQLGTAGELLFDSLMMRLGERSVRCEEHEPFDRILWLPEGFVRVQIKTRHSATGDSYVFDIKKGYQRGPNGTRPYERSEFDILALAILPENVIWFTHEWRGSHRIRLAEIPRLRARPADSLVQALGELGLSGGPDAPPEPA